MNQQATALRERRFEELDLNNVVEEVESIGRQLVRKLQDGMAEVVRLRLLLHAVPGEAWAPFWTMSMRKLLYENGLVLQDAPSVKDRLPMMLADAQETGRLRAEEELAYAFSNRRFDNVLDAMPTLGIDDLIG